VGLPVGSAIAKQPASVKTVKYDGYIETGAEYEYNDTFHEVFCRAKLEFELELTQQVEGEISFEANTNRREVNLKDAHVLLKYYPGLRIKVGNVKKRFGLEELKSREDLLTMEKTLINRHISDFGYVGREPSVQIYNKKKSWLAGVSYNQAYVAAGAVRLIRTLGSYDLGLNCQYQRHTEWWFDDDFEQEYPSNAYAVSCDVSRESSSSRSLFPTYQDFEVFMGLDPVETQYRRFSGDSSDVFFLGVKSLFSHRFNRIEPLILFSVLSPDIAYPGANEIEILAGINLYLSANVRFRINADLIFSSDDDNSHERTVEESNGGMGLQLRW
jgi:hypothetical protein